MSDIDVCPNTECAKPLPWDRDICCYCHNGNPSPLQRLLLNEAEQNALELRYQNAKLKAEQAGKADAFEQVEQYIAENSHAVMNLDARVLSFLLQREGNGINTYDLQVEGQTRLVAEHENDKKRTTIDGLLFGRLKPKIRFAALSLNHQGLTSYDKCCITFADSVMKNKATLLSENSYHFVKSQNITHANSQVPSGYRAVWGERHKLAMAKVGEKITVKPNFDDTHQLILFSEGNRDTDEFIEVHIYEYLPAGAITKVTIPNPDNENSFREQLALKLVIEDAKVANKEVIVL